MAETGQTTTTTTTTTTSEEPILGCNVGFYRSPVGIFMLVELIVGAICWSTNVSAFGHSAGVYGFAAFCIVFTWVSTLVIYLILLLGLHAIGCGRLPCGIIQIICHGVWFILMFVGACITASFARYHSLIAASTALSFILAILYVFSFCLAFRQAYNRFPWQK